MAKIINGKLVIRVGGGYMSADEFIEQYGPMEILKIQSAEEKGDPNIGVSTGGMRQSMAIGRGPRQSVAMGGLGRGGGVGR